MREALLETASGSLFGKVLIKAALEKWTESISSLTPPSPRGATQLTATYSGGVLDPYTQAWEVGIECLERIFHNLTKSKLILILTFPSDPQNIH